MMAKINYFELRGVDSRTYKNFLLPKYLSRILNNNKAEVLDFGCGFGQMMFALEQNGFKNIEGADIDSAALNYLCERGMVVHDLSLDIKFYEGNQGRFDFVIMSHVLEHIEKQSVVDLLCKVRTLLKNNGGLIVMVPNAQSNTGCYWAYEDFTHETLFTSGSLLYVLRAAGFKSVEFLDPDCLENSNGFKKLLRRFLLYIYRKNIAFWNSVTGSAFHKPSPQIFSYELKVLAKI